MPDVIDPGTERLNASSPDAATASLMRCCGSSTWARDMVALRPFVSRADIERAADEIADRLTRDDWIEAFSHHPRIGDRSVLRQRLATPSWEGSEQSGVSGDDDALLDELEQLNGDYEARFGFVFLICATGLTGAQMRDGLRERITNHPDEEWRVAAREQRRITRIRLAKLLEQPQEASVDHH